MKNLILGAIKDYGWYDIEPFFRSWRENCPHADIALFADNILPWTLSQLKTFPNVTIISAPCNDTLVVDARWTFYRQYLEENAERYSGVFLTDIRDVIFQGDPFSKGELYPSYFEYATEDVSIESTPASNALWIRKFFGDSAYHALKDKSVICAGTICGTVTAILIFLKKMEELLARSTFWGADQASMNYLVHNHLLPLKNLVESNTFSGDILTLSGLPDAEVSEGNVLSRNRSVPSVVHQYDRHKELVRLIDQTYRSPAPPAMPDAESIEDMLDILDFFWYNGKESLVLSQLNALAEKSKKEPEWQIPDERLLRMLKTHMELPAGSLTSSFIEQTLQYLMTRARNIDILQIEAFWKIITAYREQQKTLYKPFERFVGNCTRQASELMESDAEYGYALQYLERLSTIDYPLDSEYHARTAKLRELLSKGTVQK